ncbi:MAG: response regulator [Deltaproteobacteria bacterium]|jgi:signal transduction histidine kinase/ActR/RegA family two-component response regulator/HPt (histidine-containing phosphotransfer) domain-containing protein|nr:response regulator [Deltaproteobacteria bacterium]
MIDSRDKATQDQAQDQDQYLSLELELRRLRREYKKINRQYTFLQKLMARTKEATANNMNLSMVISAEKTSREIFLDLILQSSPNIFLVFDGSNRLLYGTNVLLKLLGIPHMGLLTGRTLREIFQNFVSAKDMDCFELAFNSAVAAKTTAVLEQIIDFDTVPSKPRLFVIRITPLIDPDVKTTGTLVLFHDQTEIIEASKARAASEAKSAFLAKISHEIRTPLNSIMALSKLELQNDIMEGTRNNLAKINAAGGTLLSIINDILDLTKVEIGQFVLYPAPYSFADLLSDAVSLNIVRIGTKPIKFILEIDETIPSMLFGDELRVKQIINNLLSNAFKYTEMGQVKLTISCESEGDQAWLAMTVSDTGRGIRTDDIDSIFGVYNQADKNTQRAIEGTGLGLSICKDLVELMQGTILVESEFGIGSKFEAFILQKIVDETPIGPEIVANLQTYQFLNRKKIEELDFVRFFMPKARILVVDDVETNLDVAHALLRPYGFTVDCVTSGLQALALLKSEVTEYDCIFMDHMMPDMDGIEVVRIIREQIATEYAKTVPIIAMTANALIESEKLFLMNGFQAYLPKPIDLGKLHQILTHWVKDRLSHIYPVTELTGEDVTYPVNALALPAGHNGPQAHRKPLDHAGQKGDALMTDPEIKDRLNACFIDGMDFSQGLARFEGKESTYITLLRSFVRQAPRLLEDLKHPTEENLHTYAIKVHGFKGACAGVGVQKVASMAYAQEMNAKNHDLAAVRRDNDGFIATAEILVRELGIMLRNFPSVGDDMAKEFRESPDLKTLERLKMACENFKNSEIQKQLLSLERFEYQSDSGLIVWLREQADNIEYDAIVDRLNDYLSEKKSATMAA